MQIRVFSLPAVGFSGGVSEEELNLFLRSHRVLSVTREFINLGSSSYWCFCVEYMDGAGGASSGNSSSSGWGKSERVDYREVLSPEEFERFVRLRVVRKSLAESEHIPAYAIMKDDMLSELSKLPEVDKKALLGLSGFGEKKFEKYGERFLEMMKSKDGGKEGKNEAGGESV